MAVHIGPRRRTGSENAAPRGPPCPLDASGTSGQIDVVFPALARNPGLDNSD
jgi:hypothetical protein